MSFGRVSRWALVGALGVACGSPSGAADATPGAGGRGSEPGPVGKGGETDTSGPALDDQATGGSSSDTNGGSGNAGAADGPDGSSTPSPDVNPEGSGGTPVAGGSSGAAGSSDAGGSASVDGEPSETDDEPNTIGRIQAYRTLALNPMVGGGASAQFDRVEQAEWDALAPEGLSESACMRTQHGDCTLMDCVAPTTPAEPPPTPASLLSADRLDVGTITIVSDVDDFVATGTPTGTNRDYNFTLEGSLTGDGNLIFSGTGGTIDAFEATLPFPLAPLLLSPSATGEAGTVLSIPVPRDADLELSWDARDTGEIIQIQSIASGPSFSCAFDAAGGSGTIPATALSELASGTEFHLLSVQSDIVTTPQGDIQLFAAFELFSEDRTVYPMFVLE